MEVFAAYNSSSWENNGTDRPNAGTFVCSVIESKGDITFHKFIASSNTYGTYNHADGGPTFYSRLGNS